MNSQPVRRVRGTTWALAALALILFCWLGFAVAKLSTIFDGLSVPLPLVMKLMISYGSLGLPLFGVVAAGLMILSDLFLLHRGLVTWLASVSMIIAFMVFRVFTTPICVMTSTIQR